MKLLFLVILFEICFCNEMGVYLLPHVLPEWKTDQKKIWKNWKFMLDFQGLFMKDMPLVYHVPDFYLNEIINEEENLTFYESMKGYDLTFLNPTSNVDELKQMLLPYLNHDPTAPKRGLGLLFQKTSSGKCLGSVSEDDIRKLKQMDDEFKEYENYLGMDVMDSSVLQQFDVSNDFSGEFPSIRTIHFNYFNTFEEAAVDDAINLALKYHSSVSIDICDMETQFFVSCAAFQKILDKFKAKSISYKFLVNRSVWVQSSGAFLGFFNNAQKCLEELI